MTAHGSAPSAGRPEARSGRDLGVAGFVVLVVVYLAVLQGVPQLLTLGEDVDYARMTSVDELWRSLLVPVAVSLILGLAVVSWLGWWRPVWTDDRPVQRWVVVVPALMVASILIVTDYVGLAGKSAEFVVLLLLGTLMVGLAEETMFRGIGVTVFRRRGFTEGRVALWTTVLFGVSHASNIVLEGPTAFVQVLITILAGYLFYLVRRWSGGLLAPALLHGFWDFSVLSGLATPDRLYPLGVLALVIEIALGVVLVRRRRRIEPAAPRVAG